MEATPREKQMAEIGESFLRPQKTVVKNIELTRSQLQDEAENLKRLV
jgi:hypothetical protein